MSIAMHFDLPIPPAPSSALKRAAIGLTGFALSCWLFVLLFGSLLCLEAGHNSGNNKLFRRGDVSPSNLELKVNSIAFGVPALLCFIVRIVNRTWVMKKMHWEDWLMCLTMFFYICLLTFINVSTLYDTNLYPVSDAAMILANPTEVARRILGSKIVIALEQCMLFTTWGVKLCIWAFLVRVCRLLPKYTLALQIMFFYIVFSLFIIEICYLGVFCRPFSQYYAMPVKNIQCATYSHYSIMQASFNISSDFALIVLPIVMLYNTQLPAKRRAVLVFVFSLGGFTIIAAVLNKFYNFNSPWTTTYMLWYIREASVALCVGNIICTWQLIQRIFKVRSFDNKHADIQNETPDDNNNDTNNDGDAAPTLYTYGGTPRVDTPATTGRHQKRRFQSFKDPDKSLLESAHDFGYSSGGSGGIKKQTTITTASVPADSVLLTPMGRGRSHSDDTSETYVSEAGAAVGIGIFGGFGGTPGAEKVLSNARVVPFSRDCSPATRSYRRHNGVA